MPQLDFSTWPGQIAWLLVVFGGLYLVMSRVLLPRVGSTLVMRRERISSDMAEARRLRDEAEAQAEAVQAQMGEARARAQRTAADAKAKAAAEAAERQAALEVELSQRLAEAEGRIRAARDQSMSHVRGIASEAATAMTAKLSGQAPSAGEIDRALETVGAPDGAG